MIPINTAIAADAPSEKPNFVASQWRQNVLDPGGWVVMLPNDIATPIRRNLAVSLAIFLSKIRRSSTEAASLLRLRIRASER
jgi:hypothetical protein